MVFLVLEEKSLSSNVIQFSSCFLCQQLIEENGAWKGVEWKWGSQLNLISQQLESSGVNMWWPPAMAPFQQKPLRPPKHVSTLSYIWRSDLKKQFLIHRSLFSPWLQRWCFFDSGGSTVMASLFRSNIIRITQWNLLKSRIYFFRQTLGRINPETCSRPSHGLLFWATLECPGQCGVGLWECLVLYVAGGLLVPSGLSLSLCYHCRRTWAHQLCYCRAALTSKSWRVKAGKDFVYYF